MNSVSDFGEISNLVGICFPCFERLLIARGSHRGRRSFSAEDRPCHNTVHNCAVVVRWLNRGHLKGLSDACKSIWAKPKHSLLLITLVHVLRRLNLVSQGVLDFKVWKIGRLSLHPLISFASQSAVGKRLRKLLNLLCTCLAYSLTYHVSHGCDHVPIHRSLFNSCIPAERYCLAVYLCLLSTKIFRASGLRCFWRLVLSNEFAASSDSTFIFSDWSAHFGFA